MRSLRISLHCFAIAFVLLISISHSAFAQGVTSSGLQGFVADGQQNPVAGATVTIIHTPTGSRTVTTTRSNGQFNASGLRVGGPYSVLVEASGFKLKLKMKLS
ncbi:MAG: carboxypeptidase regulatory-like domain-containing protein [Verrucomicrobia bacterium]|nr:carboxypeptidase regulatory-like domain-containing protein [Verrucomicrobiota bacterium]